MLTEILYELVYLVAKFHNYFLKLNDSFELYLNDKQLHFFIIGIIGMLLVVCIYPIFRMLAKKEHYLTLTFIYVFTLIIVLTFAIEIGQRITKTGSMEFEDIMYGVTGFLAMYLCFALVILFFKFVIDLIKKDE